MTRSINAYLAESAQVIQATAQSFPHAQMEEAVRFCVEAIVAGKPILVCGNGGSATDAMHIAAELVARFLRDRRAFNCICLSANPAIITAWSNDFTYESVFERQVEAHGCKGGVLIGISTSGTSKNIMLALAQAQKMGMKTIGLTGRGGGTMAPLCDALLDVPCQSTPFIQQVHVCLYHYLCEHVEARASAAFESSVEKQV